MEIERRITVSETSIEYRDTDMGEKRPVITGYAAVFNSESRNLGGFVETVHPSAFDEVLSTNPDVIGVFNHDRNLLLGRTGNGTMKLSADAYGLRYEITPGNTSVARDVVEWVKDRTVVGASFAFAVKKDGGDAWSSDIRGIRKREIRSVGLLEDVGPVVRPAYEKSSVVVARRCIEMALGESYRPNQTMANSAKRGLKLAAKASDIDSVLAGISERIANREIIAVEEVAYLSGVYERCLAAKNANWTGTQPWIEWQMAGGDSGLKWIDRRADAPAPAKDQIKGSDNDLLASGHPKHSDERSVEADGEVREASDVNLKPTAGMAAAAKRGLKLHEEGRSGDGLKPETVARAGKIADRETLTPDHVREMRAWFRRHKVDKKPGWNARGAETPGYTAWLLWGGDPAWRWSEAKVRQMEGDKRDIGEGVEEEYTGVLGAKDLALAESYEGIAEEYGPWSPEAAHYVADNPFAERGIKCANCVFFEAEGRCYVVTGEIAPDAICKLWVIPEDKMSEEQKEEPKQEMVEENAVREESGPDAVATLAALRATILSTHLHDASRS